MNDYKKQQKLQANYRVQWVSYFISRYGDIPFCQICGKKLAWHGFDKHLNTVQFDHRKKLSPIQKSPSLWWNVHPCNPKNIGIWEQCDFGILCLNCNTRLPTENREKWLNKALYYTQRKIN